MALGSHSIDLERGSTQYLTAADSASLSVTGDLTIEAWVKMESLPANQYIVSKRNHDTNQRSYAFSIDAAGEFNAYLSSAGTSDTVFATSGLNFPIGVWHHVALVVDVGSFVKMYVDGVLVFHSTSSVPASIHNSTYQLAIGEYPVASSSFDGKIDDVRIWATVRTQKQIIDNMFSELTGSETNLNAYWKLNNALTDATANGNTLTNVNSASFSTDVPTNDSYDAYALNEAFEFDTVAIATSRVHRWSDTRIIIAWSGGSDTKGLVQAFDVNATTGAITAIGSALSVDGTTDGCGKFTILTVDSTHFILVWRNNTSAAVKARAFAIDGSGVITTAGSTFSVSDITGQPSACWLDSTHFMIVGSGSGNDGYAKVHQVNTSTWAITASGSATEFDTTNFGGQEGGDQVVKIDSTHVLVVWYQGGGQAQVLTIDGSYNITATGSPLAITNASVSDMYVGLIPLDGVNHWLLTFTGSGNDGYAQVLAVNLSTWAVTEVGTGVKYRDGSQTYKGTAYMNATHAAVSFNDGGFGRLLTLTVDGSWNVTANNTTYTGVHQGFGSLCQVSTGRLVQVQAGETDDGYAETFNVLVSNNYSQTIEETAVLTHTGLKMPIKTFSEVITLTHTWLKTPGKVISNTIALVETVSRSISRTISETIALVETVTKGAQRTFSETITLTEILVEALRVAFKEIAETIVLVEAALGRVITKVISETISLVETVERAFQRTFSEVLTLTETVTKMASKVFSEVITLTEIFVATLGKVFSDTISLVESVIRGAQRVISNTITLTESVIRTPSKIFTETVSLVEVFTSMVSKTFSETITLTQTTVKMAGKVISNTITLVELAISTIATKAIGFILGRNNDTNLTIGKKKDNLGRNNDTNLTTGIRKK